MMGVWRSVLFWRERLPLVSRDLAPRTKKSVGTNRTRTRDMDSLLASFVRKVNLHVERAPDDVASAQAVQTLVSVLHTGLSVDVVESTLDTLIKAVRHDPTGFLACDGVSTILRFVQSDIERLVPTTRDRLLLLLHAVDPMTWIELAHPDHAPALWELHASLGQSRVVFTLRFLEALQTRDDLRAASEVSLSLLLSFLTSDVLRNASIAVQALRVVVPLVRSPDEAHMFWTAGGRALLDTVAHHRSHEFTRECIVLDALAHIVPLDVSAATGAYVDAASRDMLDVIGLDSHEVGEFETVDAPLAARPLRRLARHSAVFVGRFVDLLVAVAPTLGVQDLLRGIEHLIDLHPDRVGVSIVPLFDAVIARADPEGVRARVLVYISLALCLGESLDDLSVRFAEVLAIHAQNRRSAGAMALALDDQLVARLEGLLADPSRLVFPLDLPDASEDILLHVAPLLLGEATSLAFDAGESRTCARLRNHLASAVRRACERCNGNAAVVHHLHGLCLRFGLPIEPMLHQAVREAAWLHQPSDPALARLRGACGVPIIRADALPVVASDGHTTSCTRSLIGAPAGPVLLSPLTRRARGCACAPTAPPRPSWSTGARRVRPRRPTQVGRRVSAVVLEGRAGGRGRKGADGGVGQSATGGRGETERGREKLREEEACMHHTYAGLYARAYRAAAARPRPGCGNAWRGRARASALGWRVNYRSPRPSASGRRCRHPRRAASRRAPGRAGEADAAAHAAASDRAVPVPPVGEARDGGRAVARVCCPCGEVT